MNTLININICDETVGKSVIKSCVLELERYRLHWECLSCSWGPTEINYCMFCNLNSLGFSMFRPMGERIWSKCVQCFSLLSLMLIACRHFGGLFMNSSIVIFISLIPLWFLEL